MSIDTTQDEVLIDLEELCRNLSTGSTHDPELLKRVEARFKTAQEELRRRGKPTDSASLIRAGRDEE